jgi:hypothetical protein
MSSGHRERGFFDPRTPWEDACDVSGFNNSSTCSHSDDSGGAAAPRSTRTPRSSGYDFLCTCGLCCYMLYVYYMLYTCYMSGKEKKHGSWANLKGGGQLAAKSGNGAQMRGMVPGLGSVSGCPHSPRGNVGSVRMDTNACRCRSDMLRSTGAR